MKTSLLVLLVLAAAATLMVPKDAGAVGRNLPAGRNVPAFTPPPWPPYCISEPYFLWPDVPPICKSDGILYRPAACLNNYGDPKNPSSAFDWPVGECSLVPTPTPMHIILPPLNLRLLYVPAVKSARQALTVWPTPGEFRLTPTPAPTITPEGWTPEPTIVITIGP